MTPLNIRPNVFDGANPEARSILFFNKSASRHTSSFTEKITGYLIAKNRIKKREEWAEKLFVNQVQACRHFWLQGSDLTVDKPVCIIAFSEFREQRQRGVDKASAFLRSTRSTSGD
jgi:hypothetical protein